MAFLLGSRGIYALRETIMKKLLLTTALLAGALTFAGTATPSFAQGGAGAGAGAGAGSDVSTPRKSVPRVGTEKRDDSMNAGRPAGMKHVRHKHKKHAKKTRHTKHAGATQRGSSSNPSMAPTGTSK
jgi:hypothetical protein